MMTTEVFDNSFYLVLPINELNGHSIRILGNFSGSILVKGLSEDQAKNFIVDNDCSSHASHESFKNNSTNLELEGIPDGSNFFEYDFTAINGSAFGEIASIFPWHLVIN